MQQKWPFEPRYGHFDVFFVICLLKMQEDTCNYITSQMCDPNDQDAHQPVLQGQHGVGHGH